jgi:hypothetical protein
MSAYSLIIKLNPRKPSEGRVFGSGYEKSLSICVVFVMIIASAASLPFVLNAGFGQPPQGEQLPEVEASPQYRDGRFHNTLPTPGYNGDKNMLVAMWEFLTKKPKTPVLLSHCRW